MEKIDYLVQLGFEHPNTSHWLAAGSTVEMTEGEATQLLLSGYLIVKPAAKTSKGK
ncbi:hypothetical protein [Aeromonas sp. ARM81]|uniref:hypothetical protein n=1 Tax=Aeromonas sp. ARM81 TaxID=1747384 RepID=UPI00090C50C3|nr:hypothetical protein [Aeromonas sp. ARM81]ALN97538.1 hypothetical protein ARM81ld_p18 [Aeromonas phage phiARM81ld]